MATLTESKCVQLDASSTGGSSIITSTALSLALVLAQYAASPVPPPDVSIEHQQTQGSALRPTSPDVTEVEVFRQISRVYDELLSNQIDLDPEAKEALYANLWNLYT